MSPDDVALIERLNAVYAHALDGLVPDSASTWASTFAPDGTVSILDSNRKVIAQATGTQKLIDLWKSFPEPAATRHWFNNVIIEPEGEGARMSAYVIAMNIKNSPAIIVRTGTYRDALVKINGTWKFQQRVLTLDPASHV